MRELFAWFSLHSEVRLLAGFVFILIFSALYFRTSRGAGKLLFFLVTAGLAVLFWLSPLAHLLAFLIFPAWLLGSYFRRRPPRPAYLPASAIVEGGGVRRGLTAPEAAVLLETPINTVLACVLVGLLKKGAIQPAGDSPLVLVVAPDFRARSGQTAEDLSGLPADSQGRAAHRRAAAQQHNAILHPYEEPFLELLEESTGQCVRDLNMTAPLRALVRHAARRVGGYDLEATREYYRKHLGRARHDVLQAGGDPQGSRLLSHHLEWMVLDAEFAGLYGDYPPPWSSGSADQNIPSGESLTGWVELLIGELAGSVPAGGLQAAVPGGERLALGGEDPLDFDFFKAVYDQVWSG